MTVVLLLGAVAIGAFLVVDISRFYSRLDEIRAQVETPLVETERPVWLRGLVDVTADATLVTARGVEIPFSPVWEFEDVMETLAEVEALG